MHLNHLISCKVILAALRFSFKGIHFPVHTVLETIIRGQIVNHCVMNSPKIISDHQLWQVVCM